MDEIYVEEKEVRKNPRYVFVAGKASGYWMDKHNGKLVHLV